MTDIHRKSKNVRILVLGVNPFEDLPGYQLIGLLGKSNGNKLFAADDSEEAVAVLEQLHSQIELVPHPSKGATKYLDAVLQICDRHKIDFLIPANDAHLAALLECSNHCKEIRALCPLLDWFPPGGLWNRWRIQNWLSQFCKTPARYPYETEADLLKWEHDHNYPVVVKGMRKGGLKALDHGEAVAARRNVWKNPANLGKYGGAYLEAFIEGTERATLLVFGWEGRLLCSLGIQKLATTQLGTTLVARIDEVFERDLDVKGLLSSFSGPGVVEVESRTDAQGKEWFFEANLRFPTWIGALGKFGQWLVESFLDLVLGKEDVDQHAVRVPEPGTLIYRLPESGVLPMQETLGQLARVKHVKQEESSTPASVGSLLWPSRSPHQFLTK